MNHRGTGFRLACTLFFIFIMLPSRAATDTEVSPLVKQCLEEMPDNTPRGCVGASVAVSSLLPMISALAFSEPTPGFDSVMEAMDEYVLATEEGPRRLLSSVLMSMATVNIHLGRDTTAVRQLTQVHDQVVALATELDELLPLLDQEGDLRLYPEQGCLLMIGTRTVYFCSRDWARVMGRIPEESLSEERKERLAAMAEDLKPLLERYREAADKVSAYLE